MGRVLADLVNCLNPEAIVLGGELGMARAPFVAGARESIDRYAQPASAHAATVVAGQLGMQAELLGAIAAARVPLGGNTAEDPGDVPVAGRRIRHDP
ncbi:MAG TPA: ROK family protein [Jatrophihabitantaceae bacterium]|nr:ROK family protein [Jatrophihabitantaceae bacterium]